MKTFIAIGWIVPLLLILWRSQREPRWLACVRYVLAVLVVWQVMMTVVSHDTMVRVREARVRGDIDGSISDTGSNAAALLLGWIPGLIYATLVGMGRWVWSRFKERRRTHAVV